MSKRIVTLKLIVDMENIQCDEWVDPNDFFEEEINEVLSDLQTINGNNYKDYKNKPVFEGETASGSPYRLTIRKLKK